MIPGGNVVRMKKKIFDIQALDVQPYGRWYFHMPPSFEDSVRHRLPFNFMYTVPQNGPEEKVNPNMSNAITKPTAVEVGRYTYNRFDAQAVAAVADGRALRALVAAKHAEATAEQGRQTVGATSADVAHGESCN